jgi:hypothetical protein
MSDGEADRLFRSGRYDEAAARLGAGAEKEGESGSDVLLYLLDQGLSLHTGGKFEEAIKVFRKADKIAEIKDYTRIGTEAGTLLTSDNIKNYKGEEFENVLISAYLAMDYALIGNAEDALVEARRVNRKLELMVSQGGRKYQQNAFARYLSGVLYEAEGDPNNAYISYKKVRELEPSFPSLGRDLWRTAWMSGISQDLEQWDSEYGLDDSDHQAARELRAGKAEIVVFYENGISPIKRPNPNFRTLPKFYPRFNPVSHAEVTVTGPTKASARTASLHDIEAIAVQNLEEKYGAMVAKKLAGIVAKEVVAKQIENQTKNPWLAFGAKLAMYASDQADVRSWNLLPKDLQIARVPVDPGTYTVRITPVGGDGPIEKTVQVRRGRKVFVNFRYVPR